MNDVAVIGGGASGMMAAITAARYGAKVTIFEKNDRVGKKLLVTGNGKCNITNMTMNLNMYHSDDLARVGEALSVFGHNDTIRFFEECGLVLKDKGGYIYPYSDQASCVLDILRLQLEHYKIEVMTSCGVTQITPDGNGYLIGYNDDKQHFDRVIVACGSMAGLGKKEIALPGKAGVDLLKPLNIRANRMAPALVQVACQEDFFTSIAGVRADCMMTLYEDDIAVAREFGELQLTDKGISGIPTFQLSRTISAGLAKGKTMRVVIDFLPEYNDEDYELFMKHRILIYQGDTVEHFMLGLLNKKLNMLLIKLNGLKPNDLVEDKNVEKLIALMCMVKQWVVTCRDTMGYDKAQVCSGGITLNQLNGQLESVNHKGLYVCGEVLDVDGKCGGYNLQWAWTSGYITGKAASGYVTN